MSNDFSLYIRDKKLSEVKKVKKRQGFVGDLFDSSLGGTSSSTSILKELFDINFPIEKAGNNNCENMIGSVEIPVGLAGPVKVKSLIKAVVNENFSERNSGVMNSLKDVDDIFIPLATTEGALVASINRGCKALNLSKNLSVVVKKIGMTRALVFECRSTAGAYEFVGWMKKNHNDFINCCESTSSHLKFLSYQSFIRGRHVYLRFSFDTDEAMGMNMISIALKHAWSEIKEDHLNVKLVSLSGNVCTDKKDSMINRMFGRGFNVELEVFISKKILTDIFEVSAKDLVKNHVAKNLIGSNVAGSMSQNMHVANALAAFYIATGQDPAHVVGGSEASVTFEEEDSGLYAALTLPSISVGSVGGGTWFPKQTQARSLIKSGSQINSVMLALSAGIAAFAGEISGLCALTNQSLADAHQKLARCGVGATNS